MAIEKVKEYLSQWGRDGDILEFATSSATVALAAQALGTEPGRIAKTLSFRLPEGCVLIVAAGDAKVDNKKFKACFGCKAKMLSPGEAVFFTGHAIGGVCPFAIERDDVAVVLDESLRRFDTVYPACGSSNSAICLTLSELEAYSRAEGWADVCKLPEQETL
mgnify:CR=1 FL=1